MGMHGLEMKVFQSLCIYVISTVTLALQQGSLP